MSLEKNYLDFLCDVVIIKVIMNDSPLSIKSKQFALDIIAVCRQIQTERKEYVLTNQLLRSGTSIGANIREAGYGHSKADFIAKMQIALKECSETEYWLELLKDSDYYNGDTLSEKCVEIKRMLIASVNTAKKMKSE